jgi:hypothetical protein
MAGLLAGLTACMGGAPPPIPLKPVRFLLINDVYVADTMVDGRGGLARVATVRHRLDDQGPVIFVLAGDVLSPSLMSKYFGGAQMVDVLNAAKLDYATFGNHEFDLELDTLEARIAASNFKWISSNCTLANGAPFPKVLPWDTVRVSGHKVGLFGLTLQGSYPATYRCSNPDTAARRVVETLGSEGVDLIVGITHQTVQADRDLLAREPRIDLILGGHEHEALDSTVSGRHVAKADANARSAQFATLWGGKGSWRQALGEGMEGQPGPPAGAGACCRNHHSSDRSDPQPLAASRVHARQPGNRRHTDWDGNRRGLTELGNAPPGRGDPAGSDYQSPARVDLPVRRPEPDRHVPHHRSTAAAAAGAQCLGPGSWERWVSAGIRALLHIRPGSTFGEAGRRPDPPGERKHPGGGRFCEGVVRGVRRLPWRRWLPGTRGCTGVRQRGECSTSR